MRHLRSVTLERAQYTTGAHASAVLALATSVLAACSDVAPPVAPDSERPAAHILDGAHGGNSHFYFLPPLVNAPKFSGTFDPAVESIVEICELAGESCASVLATFTTTSGSDGETIKVAEDHYSVKWHANDYALDPAKHYRIDVFALTPAGTRLLLGHAHVDVVATGKELKNVDTENYIPLLDNRTMQIKFRIETGIVALVEVAPAEATVEVGGTQQFAATLFDLHGNVLAGRTVAWGSSDGTVAGVDGAGLATGLAAGAATITATSEFVSGSATLTVVAPAPSGIVPFASITAGRNHSCGFDASGAAYCWGANNFGQVANGDYEPRLVCDPVTLLCDRVGDGVVTTPGPVVGGLSFTAIDGGREHTCGLTAAGSAYCWGANYVGQLGVGGSGGPDQCSGFTSCSTTPVAVGGAPAFTSISACFEHTCALTAAGEAWCWGRNANGELGNNRPGAQGHSRIPVAVLGPGAGAPLAFQSLSAGNDGSTFSGHTCAVTTGGAAYCWGANIEGQVGNGSTCFGDCVATPVAVLSPVDGSTPSYTTVSAGDGHSCALTTAGEIYCWGNNGHGQLGTGSSGGRLTQPVRVQAPPGVSFVTVHAGGRFTCGLTSTGAAYCWGDNSFGKTGTGAFGASPRPVLSPGGGAALTFKWIDGGDEHACGITTDGRGYCWGWGGTGRLGNGSFDTSDTPAAVLGGVIFASLDRAPLALFAYAWHGARPSRLAEPS